MLRSLSSPRSIYFVFFRLVRLRILVLMLVSAAPCPAAAAAEAAAILGVTAQPAWHRVAGLGGRGGRPRALAQLRPGEFAAADEEGVTWWREGQRERTQIVDVRDVAFDASGRLWIGAATGLYVWSLPGRPVRRALAGGESANRVRRLVSRGNAILVASERGAFWSTSGRVFQPLEGIAANDDFTQAAFLLSREVGAGASTGQGGMVEVEIWLFGGRGLFRIRGFETPVGLRVLGVDRPTVPRPSREAGPTDMKIDGNGETIRVVYPDAIAERPLLQSKKPEGGGDLAAWSWRRPVLPPGASILRFLQGPEQVLLATDHGLLEAAAKGDGRFRRVQSGAGNSACVDLRQVGGVSVALCEAGIFQRGGPSAEPLPAKTATPALPEMPPLAEIRRRGLRRSGLSAARADAMRRGLARRALLPELELRLGADWDRGNERDADQAFVSGETRHLLDQSRDEGLALEAGLILEWDLGGLAYPADSVDLSRELRQVVTLRDDIADEINQLYFERQRIHARLSQIGSFPSEEAQLLYWRAREIDAGLDAWTGGWIADWRRGQLQKERSRHPGKIKEERR